MRLYITGGGTGGHVTPGLAIARYFEKRQPDTVVRFAGSARGIENKLVPREGYPLDSIEIIGLSRSMSPKGILHNIKAAKLAVSAVAKAKKLLKAARPDCVIGCGGYASFAVVKAAQELGIYYNTGEGGLHEDFYQYGANTIVQVASGRFGVHKGYLDAGAAIEIKIGQGAKPGIGGHLPGAKIVGDVSRTRMIPEGSDAISPAPHHDIYSIEDLRQLVYSLKEATAYKKPVIVKIAAVHNVAAIASGIARSGADIIAIDGFRGGTGAAPTRIRDNVGIPIELALASVDERLRQEGIRGDVSIVVGGSIRSSSDIVKAIALGADAVYIATSALLALGCHLCRTCQQGKCNWGIATQRPELVKRLNPDIGSQRLVNLVTAWRHEIMEMMGGMGINSIEALRGNRLMLRGIGLNDRELNILGIKHAGE